MRSTTLALWRAAGLAGALAIAGCTSDPGLTVPSHAGPVVIESFVGTLALNGSAFYSFTVPQNGTVTFTLLSLTINGVPSSLSVTLAFGVPRGTTCSVSSTGTTTAVVSPSPASTLTVTPGVFCAIVSDAGTLTAPAAFAVNIARPR